MHRSGMLSGEDRRPCQQGSYTYESRLRHRSGKYVLVRVVCFECLQFSCLDQLFSSSTGIMPLLGTVQIPANGIAIANPQD